MEKTEVEMKNEALCKRTGKFSKKKYDACLKKHLNEGEKETKNEIEINEDELELAERYATALKTIDKYKGCFSDEDELELAERYATALKTIDEYKNCFSDEDVKQAEKYAETLKEIAE